MTRFDYISVLSLIFSFLSAYHVALSRPQDNEISYLHSIESKIYDAEIQQPRLNCFYKSDIINYECGEQFTTVNVHTISYLNLVVDFKQAVEDYHENWCNMRARMMFVNDCSLYSEFLLTYKSDPTGSFAKVEADK